MDIYQHLKQEHEAVHKLFEQLEGCSSQGEQRRSELFSSLRDDLLTHLMAEQEVFHSTLLERIDEQDQLLEAVEVHAVVERLLADIASCGVRDKRFEKRVSELKELVVQHIAQEESEVFDAARKHLSAEEAQQLGEQLEARKAEIT